MNGTAAAAASTITILYHAFKEDSDGNLTYTDDPKEVAGWSVYVRVDTPGADRFRIIEDIDVDTLEEASQLSLSLAQKYGTSDIEQY